MSPHHRYKGEEHANWRWAVQVFLVVGVLAALVFGIGLWLGWW